MLKLLKKRIKGIDFKERHTRRGKDFTRTRGFNFLRMIVFQMNLTTRSLAVEVNKFFRSIIKAGEETYTKQAYSQAREKLKHTAYIELNETLIDEFYSDDDFKSYKGLRLIAIDGVKYRLPNTEELRREFGQAINSTVCVAMAQGSAAYDLLNGICIRSKLAKYSENETTLAIENIEKIKPLKRIKDLYTMDRLYPSLYFLCYLGLKGIDYLMRVNGLDFLKEIREFALKKSLKDSVITVKIEEKHRKGHKELEEFIREGIKQISFRVVKINLRDNTVEYLITSLKQQDYSRSELKEIYGLRWNEEVYFNFQKNTLEIENFSSKKPEGIRQDYYSKILVSNIEQLIISEAEDEINEEMKTDEYKYEQYKVNKSVLTGVLKDEIAEMLFEDDEEKSIEHFRYLVEIAKKNKIAVIPNRQFPRIKSKIHPSHLYKRKAL